MLESFPKLGCIDSLHSINVFNFCSYNPNYVAFEELVRHEIPNLIDSRDLGPSEILRLKSNVLGLNSLFEMVQGKQVKFKKKKMTLNLELTKALLFNGLKYNKEWTIEQSEDES